jgi:arylsulfatase A-like enzyme
MLIKWTDKIKPQTVYDNPVIIDDFLPTILDIAGLKRLRRITL